MIPRVSIIIPCFNGARHLPKLAASLEHWVGKDVEIIFVDDGSDDGSPDIFAGLVPSARIVRQANAGVAAARNSGATVARGTFLQLLDADDAILPGKLDAQCEAAERDQLDVVYSDWRMAIARPDKTEYEPIRSTPMPTEPVAALLVGWWVPAHSYLIRRSAYQAIGGSDEDLVNAQDFDLVLRLAIAGKRFGHVAGHFAEYYRNVSIDSLSRGPKKQYWLDYEAVVRKALGLLVSNEMLTRERRQAAAAKLYHIARNVYAIDASWFARLEREVRSMEPGFRPNEPFLYRIVAQTLGPNTAEFIAFRSRTLRKRVSGAG